MPVGLLGIGLAGAAIGAANADTLNTQEANIDRREALREEYATKRYKRVRADSREDAREAGAANQKQRKEDRANKLTDDELKHERALEIEQSKESGRDRRNAARIASKGGGKDGGGDAGIQLEDGSMFVPNDADSKAAVNLVNVGHADNIQEAYRIVHTLKLAGHAASSIDGLTQGTIETAMKMSNKLLPGGGQNQQRARVFNPETGRIE